jgi:hypothetical protein
MANVSADVKFSGGSSTTDLRKLGALAKKPLPLLLVAEEWLLPRDNSRRSSSTDLRKLGTLAKKPLLPLLGAPEEWLLPRDNSRGSSLLEEWLLPRDKEEWLLPLLGAPEEWLLPLLGAPEEWLLPRDNSRGSSLLEEWEWLLPRDNSPRGSSSACLLTKTPRFVPKEPLLLPKEPLLPSKLFFDPSPKELLLLLLLPLKRRKEPTLDKRWPKLLLLASFLVSFLVPAVMLRGVGLRGKKSLVALFGLRGCRASSCSSVANSNDSLRLSSSFTSFSAIMREQDEWTALESMTHL